MSDKELVDISKIKEKIHPRQEIEEFAKFAFKGRMIEMAVAFIIGSAFEKVVRAISQNLLMPGINFIIDKTGGDWRSFVWEPVRGITFEIGAFLGTFVDFLLIALVLYIFYRKIVKSLIPPEDLHQRDCPYCYTKINSRCSVCPACTSKIDPLEVVRMPSN